MTRLVKISIDLGSVSSPDELHRLLMQCLDFPAWYGCNWDAFWDSITGLVEMPEILEFQNWKAFALRLPREGRLMKSCLDDMTAAYPQAASKVIYV